MQKIRVFADTNVILESFRTGCWAAISSHFAIETVQKCVVPGGLAVEHQDQDSDGNHPVNNV